jgi:transposase
MRSSIATVDKERILLAFQRGQDYGTLAEQIGVKKDSAYRIIRRSLERNGVIALPRGGKRQEKVDQEMRDMVEAIIEDNPALTLKSINERLRQRMPGKPEICDSTVANICDAMLYTVKKLELQPVNRNAPHIKEERIVYANWFLAEAILAPMLVFVDESGFNMWTSRGQGRSKRGTPATKVVCGQRGSNVSLILAISPQVGVVHYQFSQTTTTKAIFQDFIVNMMNALPVDPAEKYVIMDNAPIHNDIVSPRQDVILKYLPPYSPPLNPIEEAFSSWKAVVKSNLSLPEVHSTVIDSEAAAAHGMTLHQWRIHHLLNIGTQSIPTITQVKCQRFFNRSVTFLHKCLNSEDI